MFIVQVDLVDASSHTQLVDAQNQIEILVRNGIDRELITIIEKDTFNPPA